MASALSPPPLPCARRTLSQPIPRAAQISNGPLSPSPLLVPRALIEIQKSRVIACLRAQDGMLALEAARAALKGGISVLEIVTSTPCILEVIKELVQEHPSSIIGVGTVLNTEDAINAVHAGAKFVMSPCTVMEILRDVQDGEILYIPGVMTPTEVRKMFIQSQLLVVKNIYQYSRDPFLIFQWLLPKALHWIQ